MESWPGNGAYNMTSVPLLSTMKQMILEWSFFKKKSKAEALIFIKVENAL
jgi:hypothetical protein